MLNYNEFVLNEYSNKLKDSLRIKYRIENNNLTDDQIDYYIDTFEFKKSSPKIKEKDITKYTFRELEEVIDSNFSTVKVNVTDDFTNDAIYNNNGLTIYEGETKDKCIKYGQGETWCISRKDASNMFNAYRYRYDEINFYFIFDSDRNDEFSKIVLLVDKDNNYYLANKNNSGDFVGSKEYDWADIVKFQPKLHDLKSIFKSKPLTQKERQVYQLIKNKTAAELFDTFKSYDIVETYISYGHVLSGLQFKHLPKELRNKYINLGHTIGQAIFEQFTHKEMQLYFSILMKNDNGDIMLTNITSLPDGIVFPDGVRTLSIDKVKYFPKNITFPDRLDGYLGLSQLLSIDRPVKFPSFVQADVYMANLKSIPEGFIFPNTINGALILSELEHIPSKVIFPSNLGNNRIGAGLVLNSVKTVADDFKLPTTIGSNLYLNNLLKLPRKFKFPVKLTRLDLSKLIELPNDVTLPNRIEDYLKLNNIKNIPDSVNLPVYIGGNLYLNNLKLLPKDKEPDYVGGLLYLKNK